MAFNIGRGWAVTSNPLGSLSLNGSSQYVTYSVGSTLAVAVDQPFTIEFWLYPLTQVQASSGAFSTTNNGGLTGHMALFVGHSAFGANQYVLYWKGMTAGTGGAGTTTDRLTSTINYRTNTWTHIAIVRSGTSAVTMYINGVSNATTTYNGAIVFSLSTLTVGVSADGIFGTCYTGYISNFRWLVGSTVYTGNFVPPTQPLTTRQNASTNISALTPTQTNLLLNTPNSAGFLADSSTNNFTPTNVGTSVAVATTPFNFSSLGSVSLNGTSQYLSAPSATGFAFGSGVDFTVEAWIYMTSYSGSIYGSAIGTTNGAQTGWMLNFGEGTDRYRIISNASGTWTDNVTCSTGNGIVLNTWTHVAMVRSGDNLYLFKNGNIVGSITGATTYNFTAPSNLLNIGYTSDGSSGQRFFPGYITNVRVINGVAAYTNTFVPPIAPLGISQYAGINISAVAGTQTSLLLQTPNNAAFITDSSVNNLTVTNTGTATASDQTPFQTVQGQAGGWQFVPSPGGSVLLNGSTQYLSATSAAMPPALGTSVFTIELWVNFAAFPAAGQFANFCNQQGDFRFFIYNDLTISAWQGASPLWVTSAAAVSLNTWYHICIMRSDATTVNIYINGVQQTKTTNTTTPVNWTTTGMLVGGESGPSYVLNGRITNFRYVLGTAVYNVAGFTPPGYPLVNIQNTKLLLLATNSASLITDSSTANSNGPYTVVNNNGATFSQLSPF